MARLYEAGIQTSIHYPPVHAFTAYREEHQRLPRTEALAARQLTLPFYPLMTESDVDIVVRALLKTLQD
jgi:dTDP-4-amino-4,6-dideoxygalactose transaminase